MPERFGGFTLIVLGESVIAVSAGTAQAAWAVGSVLTAGLGFMFAAALWWMYFVRFDDDVFNWALAGGLSQRRRAFVFGYGHLTVFAALAAVGVGIRLDIEEAIDGRHAAHAAPVLGTGLLGALIGLSLIQSAAPSGLPSLALAGRSTLAAGAIALAVVGHELRALTLMALIAAPVAAQALLEAMVEAG
jgi:low temperature requirement protein LtrA